MTQLKSLPIIKIKINPTYARYLVDTGYSTTLVQSSLVSECVGRRVVSAFDGRELVCKGNSKVNVDQGIKGRHISHRARI